MKRRIRRIRRALKRAGLYNAFHITLIVVLLTGFCVILFNVKEPEQQEKEPEEIQAEVMQNPETMTQTAENIEDKYKVFDTMSEDWGSDDLEGFVFYDLPEQYADKGYFPEKMQIYTRCLCKQYDVPYALVLAIIEQESGYEFDKTGDGGQSKGYMQIYEKWHTDRMQNLGCTDLMNPYQNVRVGIDFLSYLLKKYGTIQDTLAAYNYGEKGAREYLWSNGVYVYSYNTAIMQRIIDRFRAMGKSEKEISGIIETAADKATANPDVTKPEKPKKPEIKIETTAEAFVEAVLRTGTTLQQAKTAILKMSSLRDAENRKNTNNWRKMHGLPMRRKQKARKKHERGKGADGH